jgi:hypothetical protein
MEIKGVEKLYGVRKKKIINKKKENKCVLE